MLGWCAEPVGLDVVLGESFLLVGVFLDEGLPANGDEYYSVLVVGAIEVGISGDCRVCI